MKNLILIFTMLGALMLAGGSAQVSAQIPSRSTDSQVRQLLSQLQIHTESFRNSLRRELARSRFNGNDKETEIYGYVREFDQSTDQLRNQFNNRQSVSAEVEDVLSRGWYIDNFMRNNRVGPEAERDWQAVRADLQTLARYYNARWRWNDRAYNPSGSSFGGQSGIPPRDSSIPPRNGYGVGGRLTGTYTLDLARSDDVQRAAERATSGLDNQEAERVRASLLRRLEAPERLALEQSGRNVTIVSTSAPQAMIEANGRAQTETRPNGRVVNTTATLAANTLVINSTGDRGSDFNVTFEPLDGGRRLRVTKSIFSERLPQGIEVHSIYNRTSDVAQMNIYDDSRRGSTGPRQGGDNYDRRGGSFYIPNDIVLVATLNEDLSTRNVREGERFTLTVRSPEQYRGAIIEGSVLKTERSGRITGRSELALDFQRVRLNGREYEFAGNIEAVRTLNGEDVKIDREGSVRDDDSQTQRTVTRSGIGAALGAIIGGIAGGGTGAAIGAAVGAGAGAGTVLAQGRDDLELRRGSEFTIRASAPRAASLR